MLGHPGGVPIDMAAGTAGGSSIVRVKKWATLNIEVVTRQGRRLYLAQQTVGFVPRSTALLLLGQSACTLCGYRTIEQQDEDRSGQPGVTGASSSTPGETVLTTHQFQPLPMGLTCSPCTYQRRQTARNANIRTSAVTAEIANMQPLQHDFVDTVPPMSSAPEDQEPILQNWRTNSPSTVLEVDYVDIPALVDNTTSPSEESSDSESSMPELYALPQIATSRAHMQRESEVPMPTPIATTQPAASSSSSMVTTRAAQPATRSRFLNPSVAHHYEGDILMSDATYIVHQTNCVTRSAAGLAAKIFAKFPYADCYRARTQQDWPGTISVRGGPEHRWVVNLHGQYKAGKPTVTGADTASRRVTYFQAGLLSLEEHIHQSDRLHNSVTFPARIGCGLAGGDWSVYLACIEEFARRMNRTSGRTTWVHVCHLPESPDTPSQTNLDDQQRHRHNHAWDAGLNEEPDSYTREGNEARRTRQHNRKSGNGGPHTGTPPNEPTLQMQPHGLIDLTMEADERETASVPTVIDLTADEADEPPDAHHGRRA